MNIDIKINNSNITPVTILIPFARFINVVTVSSLLVIFLMFPRSHISFCTSLLLFKSVNVTTYDSENIFTLNPSSTLSLSFSLSFIMFSASSFVLRSAVFTPFNALIFSPVSTISSSVASVFKNT